MRDEELVTSAGSGPDVWVRRVPRVATAGSPERVLVTHPERCELRVLAGSAAAIWAELDEGTTVGCVVERVTARYPGEDRATVARGVAAFLAEAAAAGLVRLG